MPRPSSLIQVVSLCAVTLATPAVAQVAPNAGFAAIPGEREFSGRLIARPIQAEAAPQRGIDRPW